ncbi:MAG: hypothetical protein A2096_11710 [Spirochaetes bacterium GWF1_41_5]|nr:MAG: hypothetical protein A2096_11710 [Spirochaetes bacterium GWF1_41_5]
MKYKNVYNFIITASVIVCFYIQNIISAEYYIDFENGNDNNIGSKEQPWKHHPWDNNSQGKSQSAKGINNYIFKKGAIYRGCLSAKESGIAETPITLTASAQWGNGEAMIFGSDRISCKWYTCTDDDEQIPKESRKKTWYCDPNIDYQPMMAYELCNGEITRLNIARSPNWKIVNPDDPRQEWREFTKSVYEYDITLDDAAGFSVGDQVSGTGVWIDKEEDRLNFAEGYNTIQEINGNKIKVLIAVVKKGEFQKGAKISSKKTQHTILEIKASSLVMLEDKKNLVNTDPEYLKGGLLWYEGSPMPFPRVTIIEQYMPEKNCLISKINGSEDRQYCRYFIEGLPQLLDEENEWCYTESGRHKGRLYLRLKDNRDPNASDIEIARHKIFLDIFGQKHIVVNGLSMKFFNRENFKDIKKKIAPFYFSPVIRITAGAKNISIVNCRIEHCSQGIGIFPAKNFELLENFFIISNTFLNIDNMAVYGETGEILCWGQENGKIEINNDINNIEKETRQARLKHLQINNNFISNTGFRQDMWNCEGAISLRSAEMYSITSNIVLYSYAQGIMVKNGSYYNEQYHHFKKDYPLNRNFINNNIVIDSLLAVQDYGGIESWYAGPVYIYNNISGNPVGMKYADKKQHPEATNNHRTGCFGGGIYLDQGFKHYIFNNILWGKNNNDNDFIYNSAGFIEAEGFMNVVFNNTIYNFALGMRKGMNMNNRSYYLNNLFINMGQRYIYQQTRNTEMENLAFAGNIFNGQIRKDIFCEAENKPSSTLQEFVDFLTEKSALAGEAGEITETTQVTAASKHDFHLKKDSVCIDKAKKVFVPWGLYRVEAEWGFYRQPKDVSIIIDEHLFWNKDWTTREDVRKKETTPRRDLKAFNINENSFKPGLLESWTSGSLELNGIDQYCSLERKENQALDIGLGNFLIEITIKLPANAPGKKTIIEKTDGKNGYGLYIEHGKIIMLVIQDKEIITRESIQPLTDSAWQHIIAEIDRSTSDGINIYLNGVPVNGKISGKLLADNDISCDSDLLIGKDRGNKYLACQIDFLRIAKGSLKDAETTINELYNWEFNGPFLKDFYGNTPAGRGRDAGAIEYLFH